MTKSYEIAIRVSFVALFIGTVILSSQINALEKRVTALEAKLVTHTPAALDVLIEQKRKESCGDLKRLPCLMNTGYWR